MLRVTCVKKVRRNGVITEYVLEDMQGVIFTMSPKTLAYFMTKGIVIPTNLRRDVRGRIIDLKMAENYNENNSENIVEMSAMLTNKLARDAEIKVLREQQEKRQLDDMLDKIHSWTPRIQAILTLMQKIKEQDKELWGKNEVFTGNLKFCNRHIEYALQTDGFYHRLGAISRLGKRNSEDKYTYELFLGMQAGGACGDSDFFTNGQEIYFDKTKGINAFGLKKFIAQFEDFEKAFFAWFKKHYKA